MHHVDAAWTCEKIITVDIEELSICAVKKPLLVRGYTCTVYDQGRELDFSNIQLTRASITSYKQQTPIKLTPTHQDSGVCFPSLCREVTFSITQ